MSCQLARIVKRYDIGKHAQRLMDGHDHIALGSGFPVIRKGLSIKGIGRSAIDPEDRRVGIDLGPALFHWFSAFFAHHLGDFFYMLFNQAGVFFQNTHLFVKWNGIPLSLPHHRK